MLKWLNRKQKKREAIMEAVKRATDLGCRVILSETEEGTRIIVLGKDILTRQLEEIAKREEVQL